MKQGGTFTTTIPVSVTYTWYPEEPETNSEPKVEEEFEIESMMMGDLELFNYIDCLDFEEDIHSMFKQFLRGQSEWNL